MQSSQHSISVRDDFQMHLWVRNGDVGRQFSSVNHMGPLTYQKVVITVSTTAILQVLGPTNISKTADHMLQSPERTRWFA